MNRPTTAYRVTCPECGSTGGRPCRVPYTATVTATHASRVAAWTADRAAEVVATGVCRECGYPLTAAGTIEPDGPLPEGVAVHVPPCCLGGHRQVAP